MTYFVPTTFLYLIYGKRYPYSAISYGSPSSYGAFKRLDAGLLEFCLPDSSVAVNGAKVVRVKQNREEFLHLNEIEIHDENGINVALNGQCYSSSVSVGNSGNRGRCSQACRDEYETTATGNKFPLNLKDNSAYFDLPELVDAGVDSLKIEGRIKGAQYVHGGPPWVLEQFIHVTLQGRLPFVDKFRGHVSKPFFSGEGWNG